MICFSGVGLFSTIKSTFALGATLRKRKTEEGADLVACAKRIATQVHRATSILVAVDTRFNLATSQILTQFYQPFERCVHKVTALLAAWSVAIAICLAGGVAQRQL